MSVAAAYAAAHAPLVRAEARKREAEEYFRRGQWPAAIAAFRDAARLAKQNIASKRGMALYIAASNNLAMSALRGNEAREAESACNDILELAPENFRALYRRGLARAKLKKWAGARADFDYVLTTGQEAEVLAATTRALEDLKKAECCHEQTECASDDTHNQREIQPAPKFLTVPPPPRQEKHKPTINRGFLERARMAKERRMARQQSPSKSAKVGSYTDSLKPSTMPVGPECERGVALLSSPGSVFTVKGASARPELALKQVNYLKCDTKHKAAVAALGAALQIVLQSTDAPTALNFAEPFVKRSRQAIVEKWGVRLDRFDGDHGGTPVTTQLRARFVALCNASARHCLNDSFKDPSLLDKALSVFATEGRGSCGTMHKGHELVTRDVYAARAKVRHAAGDIIGSKLDALRGLALDQWASDLVKHTSPYCHDPLEAFSILLEGRMSSLLRPGSSFRKDNGLKRFLPKRPGQKIFGARAEASKKFANYLMVKHGAFSNFHARWALMPQSAKNSARAGDIENTGHIHLFLFTNDGRWTGGQHIIASRTAGGTAVALDFAESRRKRHQCASSYTLYLRDGGDGSQLPTLPNFSWVSVGDDFDKVWAAADGKRSDPCTDPQRYLSPANPKDVAKKWQITNPSLPRVHAHWIVSGRLRIPDFESGLDTFLSEVADGRCAALREANLAQPLQECWTLDYVRLALATAVQHAQCYWSEKGTFSLVDNDSWRCIKPEDAPRALFDAKPSTCGTALEVSNAMEFFDHNDSTQYLLRIPLHPDSSSTAPIARDARGCQWKLITEKLGIEAQFGNLVKATARLAHTGAVMAARYNRCGLLIAQCRGVSRLLVFDSLYHASLYAYPEHHELRRYSRLNDLAAPDTDQFPLSAELRGVEIELSPGDVIALPRGWWYQEQVASEDDGINITAEFEFDHVTSFSTSANVALNGCDLALAAAKFEVAVGRTFGKRQIASFISEFRAEILNTGWQACHDQDAGPLVAETSLEYLRAISIGRYALGELLGIDALEFFASRYLSAARWFGLKTLSDEDASRVEDEIAEKRKSKQSQPLIEVQDTKFDSFSYSDDEFENDEHEFPIVVDITAEAASTFFSKEQQ